jgi:hypothetical protein
MDKDFDLDKIIDKLTGLRNQKPGKTVNLLESEYRFYKESVQFA